MPLHLSNRKFALSLNMVFVSTILFATRIFADTLDSVQNEPPTLVTDPLIRATPELLKQGLWGSASFEAGIDSTGFVNSCTVTPSQNHAFDSLVKSKVALAQFTPAIENGRAVPSAVRFEIAAPYDSLVSQCLRLPPNFMGMVIDTVLRISLPKTRILLYYTDTTEDSALTIGFSRYLSLIGNSAGQKYDGKLLETVTDSLGRFTFRLLPRGHFTVSVQSAGYEIGQFRGHITGDESQQCRYILKSSEVHSRDSTYEITVYGRPTFTEKKIVIAEEEKHTGFSPFLSNVVQAKAEIRRVPEGPSKMLVRSGCPFDNVYVIAGVPMLAPFHFGGHPYMDIDGLMISALTNVKVTINDIAAKRVNASGCIVEADPGMIKYDNIRVVKGFYLKGDFSYLGVDLLAAYSAKKKPGDFVQIGYSVSNDNSLKWQNIEYASVRQGNQGIGVPLNYGNATLAGSKTIASLRYTAFGWLAWDSYNVLKATAKDAQRNRDSLAFSEVVGQAYLPWGMGSIKINADTLNRSLTIGGAHQFFGSGKQIFTTVITTRSYLNNGEITADFDTIIRTPFVAKLTTRINHDEWYGYLSQLTNDSIDKHCNFNGSETGLHLNTSLIKQNGHITSELDLLASVINYTDSTQLIGDAGVSANYKGNDYQAGIHFGRVTSRPDIRGLPDSLFRMQLNHTYIASLPLFFRYCRVTKFGVTPYVRYSTNTPQLDPVNQVWDPKRSTPVLAGGADFDCRIVPTSWAELSTALNLANTRRLSATDNSLAYEWNLPWTIRTSLHLHTKSDRIHLYVDYIRTEGLPYYDIDNQVYAALPVYRSIDLNLQVRGFMPGRQRHINKLDCFATLKNVQDLLGTMNLRDYYWDRNGNRRPVYLGNGRMDIGMRFGIKL